MFGRIRHVLEIKKMEMLCIETSKMFGGKILVFLKKTFNLVIYQGRSSNPEI